MKKPFKVAIVTVSDRVTSGEQEDLSGALCREILEKHGYVVCTRRSIPDEQAEIEQNLLDLCREGQVQLILTSGGTGLAARDVTPEATLAVCDRLVPGIPEALRAAGAKYTPHSYLSRAQAGICRNTLIINLPGNPKAVRENLTCLFSFLEHGLATLRGDAAAGRHEAHTDPVPLI